MGYTNKMGPGVSEGILHESDHRSLFGFKKFKIVFEVYKNFLFFDRHIGSAILNFLNL